MTWSLVLVSLGLVLAGYTTAEQPDFDPEDVVRRVRRAQNQASGVERPESDEGEFLVDTSITYVPSPHTECSPAVAFDGTNYMIAWVDSRSRDSGIYCARVTPEGMVLDPEGIAILATTEPWLPPAVVFGGTNYLVVWQDYRGSWDIYGARVTPEGTLLDPDGIAISAEARDQEEPAVAFDGANFFVVWQDKRSGGAWMDVYGARVTPDGVVLDTSGFAISSGEGHRRYAAVAFDGANHFVAWTDERNGNYDIYGARVTPAGTVLDSSGIAISTAAETQRFPALSSSGASFLVVWQDKRDGSDYDIYGARVTPSGVVLDPAGIPISAPAYFQENPAVAFDGTDFLVVWEDYRAPTELDVYGCRVTPDGTVLEPNGIALTTAADWQLTPAVAFDGTNLLVVWEDCRSRGNDIYGTRVTLAGTVLDPAGIALSTAANEQRDPAVASNGADFLTVWREYRGRRYSDIYGMRVTAQGAGLDSSSIAVSTGTASNQYGPAMAFDGTSCLVVWADERGSDCDIYGARVTRAGTVLDPEGIVISTAADGQRLPAVASDGRNFLVVWEDGRSDWKPGIYGCRVTSSGVVLDRKGIAISTAAEGQADPAAAFGGSNYMVVWKDYRNGSHGIYGARVTPQGTVLDTSGIMLSTGEDGQYCPEVAFDGANFLVVWQDSRSGTRDIYGARVTPDAVVLDSSGVAISSATGQQEYPVAAFDGSGFLVAWMHKRNGSDWDVYGARVTPGGAVYDEGPVVIQEGDQELPALACGTGGQMLLVYQGWAGTVGNKGYNAYRIWGKMNPNPGVEEGRAPIVSGQEPIATIVRGRLFLSEAVGGERSAVGACLLDIAGRKVMALAPGENDIRHLAPGVYFVRQEAGRRTSKVVVTD